MTPTKLSPPEDRGAVEHAIEHAELMIEESIDDLRAIRNGGQAKRPSHLGTDYDEAYAQGRKDACRVILLALRDREHVTSEDAKP